MSMRTLGSLSLLATGILVGFGIDRPGSEDTTSPLTPIAVPAPNPALLPANDETNLRITPVVKAVQRAADSVVSIYLVDGRSKRSGIPAK